MQTEGFCLQKEKGRNYDFCVWNTSDPNPGSTAPRVRPHLAQVCVPIPDNAFGTSHVGICCSQAWIQGFWSGGPNKGFFSLKLPENCMILTKPWGQRGAQAPRTPWIRKRFMCGKNNPYDLRRPETWRPIYPTFSIWRCLIVTSAEMWVHFVKLMHVCAEWRSSGCVKGHSHGCSFSRWRSQLEKDKSVGQNNFVIVSSKPWGFLATSTICSVHIRSEFPSVQVKLEVNSPVCVCVWKLTENQNFCFPVHVANVRSGVNEALILLFSVLWHKISPCMVCIGNFLSLFLECEICELRWCGQVIIDFDLVHMFT